MLTDASGNKMFRRIQIRILFPDNVLPSKLLVQRAPAHRGFTPTGVDEMLDGVADQLDVLYPWWQFTLVELSAEGRTARCVFKFAGYRSVNPVDAPIPELANIQLPKEESSDPKPETAESSTPTEAKSEVGNTLAAPPSQVG